MSDRQKMFYAIVASAFFHAAVAFLLGYWAVGEAKEVAKSLPDLAQLEVTLMPAAKTIPAPVAAATPGASRIVREVIDSDGLTASKQAPAKALFESDVNMQAGSELPATGRLPLPSQSGKTRSFIGFKDQQSSFGEGVGARDVPQPRPVPPATAQPRQMPNDVAQEQPAPAPAATPKAEDNSGFALGKVLPTPMPTPFKMARLDPSLLRGHADMKAMARATPEPPSAAEPEPGMHQEIDKTGVNGGITRRGPPGVDAQEGPFGKYHKQIGTLIGSRWNHYVKSQPDLIAVGDVTILIKISPSGRVTQTRVISNNANDGLAALSIKAIMDCKLPPLPDDLAPMLRDGKLEIPYTFTVYEP